MKKEVNLLQEKFKKFDDRLRLWQILVIFICLSIITWLFLVQVVDIKNYKIKAIKQRSSQNFIMRGEIVDRNGEKLASDKTSFNIFAHTNDYDHTPQELAEILSPILKIPVPKLKKRLEQEQRIILLKKDVDRVTALKIKKLALREVSTDKKNERVYPQGTMAAHVLGYYNPDADIKAGVEYSANKLLEDAGESIYFEKTPNGDIIYDSLTDLEATINPIKGKTLKLTLHNGIQHVCEKELKKTIEQKKALRGAIIVINPKNGEILGYAVYPNYDPNFYKKAMPSQIKNWTLTDVYPPGSTFKVLTVAAAMEAGKINEFSKIQDTGKMKIGGWEIKNYDYLKNKNPGKIDLCYLFEHSSNVGSANTALMIEKQNFYNILKRFGIGRKTGIDLPSESIGILPDYKQWDKSTHAAMGYGYGASVTAMQMASIISAIANNGVRVTPHVIKYEKEEEHKNKVKYTQIMSPTTAQSITRLLVKSIENTKSPVNLPNYTVAAKTGTSKKPLENGRGYSNKLYTSIVGFLPASDPQFLVYVVIDSASGYEVWGSTVAAPVFREVALQVARILNIAPDKNVQQITNIKS